MTALAAAPGATPPADRAEQDRRKAEAAAWLSALPSVTVLRGPRLARAARLVMHRTAAGSPEFWEKTWTVSPPYRMRGWKLPPWYRDLFLRALPRDGLIVEAGCGNGNVLRMLANEGWDDFRCERHGGRVEGLDFAADAIAENRRVHPEGLYRVGDVRALPYADGEIAGYVSLGVVEHFGEAERAAILREAARCLRPGGVAIISVPSFSPVRRARAVIGGYARERGAVTDASGRALDFYQFFFTPGETRRQIEAAGLRVTETDGYDCRKGFTDTFGMGNLLAWLERRGERWAKRIEHPPRPVRRLCPHMTVVVATKPG